MKQYEKISLIVLYSVFFILLFLMGFPSLYLGLFEGIIIGAFYLLGIAVPLYFLIQFIIKRTFNAFKLVIVASIPMIIFIIIITIILIQFGQTLDSF